MEQLLIKFKAYQLKHLPIGNRKFVIQCSEFYNHFNNARWKKPYKGS